MHQSKTANSHKSDEDSLFPEVVQMTSGGAVSSSHDYVLHFLVKVSKSVFLQSGPRSDRLERLSSVLSDFISSFLCYFITFCYRCERQPCSASLKPRHAACVAHAQCTKRRSMKNNNNLSSGALGSCPDTAHTPASTRPDCCSFCPSALRPWCRPHEPGQSKRGCRRKPAPLRQL